MVRFCIAKARECRRGAERATDPFVRQSWLEMEGQWFFLARSYDNERRDDSVLLHVSVRAEESKERLLGLGGGTSQMILPDRRARERLEEP